MGKKQDHATWSHHFMASRRGKCRSSDRFTADNGCSHEIRRHLLLGRKAMTNLDSILKSKDIYTVKFMAFPVAMYGCESWTKKKAEHERTDTFELWCWRRLLRVPWTAVATGLEKVSFHSNPKEKQFQRMFKLPHNCTHLIC